MTALIIYFAIAGTDIPWPHRIVWYRSEAECRAALPKEVAQARRKYVVSMAGCVDPRKAAKPG